MILSHDPKGDIRVNKERAALEDEGCEVVILFSTNRKFPKPVRFIGFQYRCSKVIGEHVDVVHCHDLDTVLLGILLKRKTGCKLVFDSHEYYLWMLGWPEKVLYPYFWLLQRIAQRFVDVLIVISPTMREYFEENYHFKEIVIVRNTQ